MDLTGHRNLYSGDWGTVSIFLADNKQRDVLARAKRRGVSRIIAPAYDHASWPRVRTVAREPGVFSAIGLHPWQAKEGIDAAGLTRELREARAVAVGEVGLDFKIEGFDHHVQLAVLEAQLEVAQSWGIKFASLEQGDGADANDLLAVLLHRALGCDPSRPDAVTHAHEVVADRPRAQ